MPIGTCHASALSQVKGAARMYTNIPSDQFLLKKHNLHPFFDFFFSFALTHLNSRFSCPGIFSGAKGKGNHVVFVVVAVVRPQQKAINKEKFICARAR